MSSNINSNNSENSESIATSDMGGIGRFWFAVIFSILFVLASVIPNWGMMLQSFISLPGPGAADVVAKVYMSHNLALVVIQILIWNFIVAIVTAPVFYLRIKSIRLGYKWILALIIPFVWSVLLVRCLVYQTGYTATGKLDRRGQQNIKIVTYAMYVIGLLSVTYLLADLF